MACGMPEVLSNRCGDQGPTVPLLHTRNGVGQPTEARCCSGCCRFSGLNGHLQGLVNNDQLIGIGDSSDALLQEAGMGGHQAATAPDQNRLE